jgi:hypothetical protein
MDNPALLREMTAKAERLVRGEWSYRETTRALRAWASNPELAGDNRLWFEEGTLGRQRELASHELTLDRLFAGKFQEPESKDWKRLRKFLGERWPWPDGRKWHFGKPPP